HSYQPMKGAQFRQEKRQVLHYSAGRKYTDLLPIAGGRQRNTPQYLVSTINLPLMTFLLPLQKKRISHHQYLSQAYEQRERKNTRVMLRNLDLMRWQKY